MRWAISYTYMRDSAKSMPIYGEASVGEGGVEGMQFELIYERFINNQRLYMSIKTADINAIYYNPPVTSTAPGRRLAVFYQQPCSRSINLNYPKIYISKFA